MDTKERDDVLFPPGLVDEHNEPLDTRSSTTWDQQIDEISPVELMEVQIVNSTVPFMFISSFTPLLKVFQRRTREGGERGLLHHQQIYEISPETYGSFGSLHIYIFLGVEVGRIALIFFSQGGCSDFAPQARFCCECDRSRRCIQ
jgi:hypothetical protein